MQLKPLFARWIIAVSTCAIAIPTATVTANAWSLVSVGSTALNPILRASGAGQNTQSGSQSQPTPPSGQSSPENYPTLSADQMRDMAVGSNDIAFMVRLIQMRQNAEQLNTANFIGVSTDLKFFIQLNNCNNPQINRLLDNEFEYPKIAAYYKERAPEILSKIPTTISYWLTYSLRQYDSSTHSFWVDPKPRIMPVDGIGQPNCKIFGGPTLYKNRYGIFVRSPSNADGVDRYLAVPFGLTRLPMAEEAARQYLSSLPNPAQRQIALKFRIQLTPDSVSCKSAAQVRGATLSAPRAPGDVALNPEFWADIREQLQDARDQCVYSGPLVGNVAVAAREDGATLATFDPNPSTGSDSLAYKTSDADFKAITIRGSVEDFATQFPTFLARSVAGTQIHKEDYAKEQDFITNAVKLCSSLTPEMQTKGWENGEFHSAEIGSQYAICKGMTDVSKAVGGHSPASERGLTLNMSLPNSRLGLRATVFFGSVSGELIANINQLRIIDFFITK